MKRIRNRRTEKIRATGGVIERAKKRAAYRAYLAETGIMNRGLLK